MNSWLTHLWSCAEETKNNAGQNSGLLEDIRKQVHRQQQEMFWPSVSRVQVPHVFLKCQQSGIDLGQVRVPVHRGVPGYRSNTGGLFIEHFFTLYYNLVDHSVPYLGFSLHKLECCTMAFWSEVLPSSGTESQHSMKPRVWDIWL